MPTGNLRQGRGAGIIPAEFRPSFKQIGIDLPQWNGDDTHELPILATYVLDGDGVIRRAFVDADFTQRAEPALSVAGAASELNDGRLSGGGFRFR